MRNYPFLCILEMLERQRYATCCERLYVFCVAVLKRKIVFKHCAVLLKICCGRTMGTTMVTVWK